MPRTGALLAALAVALAVAACGGGGDGGGGGGGGDIVAEAAQVEQLMERLKALPDTATTDQQFTQQLAQIRNQVQTAIEEVADADASEGQESAKSKLSSRLQGLRTALGRVGNLAAGGDVDAARTAIGSLLGISGVEDAIAQVRAADAG